MSAAPNLLEFRTQSAPESLVEKYRPRRLSEFCGIAKPKEILQRLAERPYSSSWIFRGESGTGKTTAALALAEMIPAEVQHVAAAECNIARVQEVWDNCRYYPPQGKQFWMVLVDEADQMSTAAQVSWLSKLDATAPAAQTVTVFTCNDTERFEPRFLSRSRVLEFSNYAIQTDAVKLLARVWDAETSGKTPPNLARIVKEVNGNIRAALMQLEMEILLA